MYQQQLPPVNPLEIDLEDDFSFFPVPEYDPWTEPLWQRCDCCRLDYPIEELTVINNQRICRHCE